MSRHGVQPMEASAEEYQKAFATPAPSGGDAPRRSGMMVAPMQDASALPALAPPRDEAKVLQKISALAAAAGEDWYYRFPVNRSVKDENGRWTKVKDWIEGPSIKCANNVARIFGNCLVQARVGDETDEAWIFLARFIDRETGFVLERAFQQRKAQASLNTKDPGRALDIVFQIGQSKSIRNVVCNALETFTERAFEEAKKSLVNRIGSKLEDARAWIIQQLATIKVSVERVEYAHARKAKDWLAPDMALIYAEINSVNDGMAHPEELWPIREPDVDGGAKEKDAPRQASGAAKAQDRPVEQERRSTSESNQELENAGRDRDDGPERRERESASPTSPAAKDEPAPASGAPKREPAPAAAEEEQKPAPRRRRTKEPEPGPGPDDGPQEGASAQARGKPEPQKATEAAATEPKPPADDQPRLMPYQSPPKFWAEQFIKLVQRMGTPQDINRLVELNAQNLLFIERTAHAIRDEVRTAIEAHRDELDRS